MSKHQVRRISKGGKEPSLLEADEEQQWDRYWPVRNRYPIVGLAIKAPAK